MAILNNKMLAEATWPGIRWKNSIEGERPCPSCGGDNRLFVRIDNKVRATCRQCHVTFFPDKDQSSSLTEEERLEITEESRKRKELQAMAQATREAEFDQFQPWKEYMTMTGQQRSAWKSEGLSFELQDRYQLGYVEQREFWNDGISIRRDALTIPMHSYDSQINNIQFRMLNVPKGWGKYRSLKGFPMSLFFAIPSKPIGGRVVLVEGAKKAMLIQEALDSVGYYAGVIAIHSKMPSVNVMLQLDDADELIIALDPDAYVPDKNGNEPAVSRIISAVSTTIRAARFSCKPDDLIHKYGGTADDIVKTLQVARFVKMI
ncbi:MAG: hypothetical protein DRI46_10320 [Chloroflexi bacterium]|nr:MAG: hypothetical protein DRI46_10320 [Chloroflexota bacterium]